MRNARSIAAFGLRLEDFPIVLSSFDPQSAVGKPQLMLRAISRAASFKNWLLKRANTCGAATLASRCSHDSFRFGPLNTSSSGLGRLRC